ncbi:hypothetical protein HI914_04672 [Erysiphe necator]|nr:hypothetical protein HI914_04672 [Erysiphe necator]
MFELLASCATREKEGRQARRKRRGEPTLPTAARGAWRGKVMEGGEGWRRARSTWETPILKLGILMGNDGGRIQLDLSNMAKEGLIV